MTSWGRLRVWMGTPCSSFSTAAVTWVWPEPSLPQSSTLQGLRLQTLLSLCLSVGASVTELSGWDCSGLPAWSDCALFLIVVCRGKLNAKVDVCWPCLPVHIASGYFACRVDKEWTKQAKHMQQYSFQARKLYVIDSVCYGTHECPWAHFNGSE